MLRQFVLDQRFDAPVSIGDSLYHPFCFTASLCPIEQNHLAGSPDVVPGDDPYELGRMVRNRPRMKQRIRPVGIRTVVLALPGPVRIHREEHAIPDMWRVGIVPAKVEDSAIGHDRRVVRVVLLKGDLSNVATVGVHLVHHADDHAGIAGHSLQRRCRDHSDFAAGKSAWIVEVNIVLVGRGQLPQAGAIRVDLKHVPVVVAARHGEQNVSRVPIEIQILQ